MTRAFRFVPATVILTTAASSALAQAGSADAYTPAIAAAHAHLRLNEPAEARRWLDAAPEAERAWEWNLLNALADMSERAVAAHEGGALALAISPDGGVVATAGADNTIRLWSAPNLRPLGALQGHASQIRDIAFSADGRMLASASADRSVRVWDVEAQSLVAALEAHTDPVSAVAFSPDGARVVSTGYTRDPATGIEGAMILWDLQSRAPERELRIGVKPVRVVLWPAENAVFAADWDGDLHRVDASTGSVTKIVALMSDDGPYRAIDSMALTADSATVYLGAKDNIVHRVATADGEHAPLPGPHADNILALALSPDGRWLASGSVDQTIALRDAESGEVFLTLRGHTAAVNRVAFSPDGARLYSVGADGDLRSWLVTGADGVTDALTPDTESHYGVCFSADGRTVFFGGWCGFVHIVDAVTGVERSRFTAHQSSVNALAVSPDGERILTCSNDGTVRLHAADGKLLATAEGHGSQITDVQFSPDGAQALSVSSDMVVLRDAATLKAVTQRPGARAHRAAFSPDGTRLALACGGGTIEIVEIGTLEPVATLAGHSGTVRDVAFSPDGARLASAGDDGTVRAWDVASSQPLATMRGHVAAAMAVSFSPDGRRVASCAYDQTVRIWNAETGAQLLALRPSVNDGVYDVAWSADGATVAAAVMGAPSTRWTAIPLPARLSAGAASGR